MFIHVKRNGTYGTEISYASCMDCNTWTKDYLKSICGETIIVGNGFVKHKPKDDSRNVSICGKSMYNRWLVPYNLDLWVKYVACINVKPCTQKKVIKYLYKYTIRDSLKQS